MNRVSLAFARILFFVLLFISTACNKIDRSLTSAEFAAPRAEAPADAEVRVRELNARVTYLEAQLKELNKQSADYSEIPGGVTWD